MVGEQVYALNPAPLRYGLPTKRLRGLYYRRRVQQLVDRFQPAAILFNTAEPADYLRAFRLVRHPLKMGIVHNPRREGIDYAPRGPGEVIFCLHDYNYHLLQRDRPVDGYLSPFFRYCALPPKDIGEQPTEIAVQGVISFNRRDYPMLIDLCRRLADRPPRPRLVFNILGDADIRDGPRLRQMISEHGLGSLIKVHSWLPDAEFFRQVQQAHYVMPLLTPGAGPYAGGAKASAAYGHSGAYGKPLILHRATAELWGIPENACVTYTDQADLRQKLCHLSGWTEHARRYRTVIEGKIRENKAFLQSLANRHPGFAAFRP